MGIYDQAEKNQSITIFFSCIGAKRHCFSAIDTELSVLRSDRQEGSPYIDPASSQIPTPIFIYEHANIFFFFFFFLFFFLHLPS